MENIPLNDSDVKPIDQLEDYINLGWALIPICKPAEVGCRHHGADCRSPGKKALVKWKQYQRKPPSARTVRSWFSKWPEANIAVITGEASGIAVLDIDTAPSELELGPMELTPTSLTGRGQHRYFRLPQGSDSRSLDEALEFKANRKYVVLPTSIHSSGAH